RTPRPRNYAGQRPSGCSTTSSPTDVVVFATGTSAASLGAVIGDLVHSTARGIPGTSEQTSLRGRKWAEGPRHRREGRTRPARMFAERHHPGCSHPTWRLTPLEDRPCSRDLLSHGKC